MSSNFDLVKRFPWLPSLITYYSDIGSGDTLKFIRDISNSETFKIVKKRIINLFNEAFNNIEEMSNYEADESNIYIYLFVRILLYIFDNRKISNRVANLYSKTTYKELNKENEYNLYYIYKDLKLEVLYEEIPSVYKTRVLKGQRETISTNFKINFIDYLKLASTLKDENRRLVNNALMEGYVYIQPKNLNRLIQEHVRLKLLTHSNRDSNKLEELFDINEFKDLYDEITEIWDRKKEEFEYSFDVKFKEGEDMSEILPPCIKEILSKAKDGHNLIHTERLFIVWFLNALEYPVDTIVDIFSTLPDFNREKTEYQVKFAKKKKYTPYSCQTLKSNGLCKASEYKDVLCIEGYYSKTQEKQRNLSHPLAYVRIKQYRSSKIKITTPNMISKKNE